MPNQCCCYLLFINSPVTFAYHPNWVFTYVFPFLCFRFCYCLMHRSLRVIYLSSACTNISCGWWIPSFDVWFLLWLFHFWFIIDFTVAQQLYLSVLCVSCYFFLSFVRSLFYVLNMCMQQTINRGLIFNCWLHLVLFVLWWCIVWWRKAILWCQNTLIMQVAEFQMNLSLTSVA